jgi:hypothetical protein
MGLEISRIFKSEVYWHGILIIKFRIASSVEPYFLHPCT